MSIDVKRPLARGDELTLTVTDLNNLGAGVAHAPDGRAVFVPGAVSGDTVRDFATITFSIIALLVPIAFTG